MLSVCKNHFGVTSVHLWYSCIILAGSFGFLFCSCAFLTQPGEDQLGVEAVNDSAIPASLEKKQFQRIGELDGWVLEPVDDDRATNEATATDEATVTQEARENSESPAPSSRLTLSQFLQIVIPLTGALVALLVLLVLYLRKRRVEPIEFFFDSHACEPDERSERSSPVPARLETNPNLETHGALTVSPVETTPVIPAMVTDCEHKECPACGREYSASLALCPFDSEKLLPKGYSAPERLPTDYLDTSVHYMKCGKCGRSFDIGTRYCPYDHDELFVESDEDTYLLFGSWLRCPECDADYEPGISYCPDDDTRLICRDSEGNIQYSPIPLLICPLCTEEYTPPHTRCPEDDSLLLYLMGRRSSGLPMTGIGSKTMMCPQCGLHFVQDMRFCAKDGTLLIAIT